MDGEAYLEFMTSLLLGRVLGNLAHHLLRTSYEPYELMNVAKRRRH